MDAIVGEYQRFLQRSSWYAHHGEGNAAEMAYLTLGLVGETGEFADQLKKIVRKGGFADKEVFSALVSACYKDLILELGDVFWYALNLPEMLNISVDEILVLNTLKLYRRLQQMYVGGSLPIEMPEWPFTAWTIEDAEHLWVQHFGEKI